MMIEKVYQKLPKSIQYAAKYAYGTIPMSIRYGKVFRDTYAFLQESQWWSKEQLEEYQLEQLSKLLHHAYENVPYYRRVFDERGLKPRDIQDFKDLQQLPYLTKDIFKMHFNDIVARNHKLESLSLSHTSGTTGKALRFYKDPSEDQKEWAFVCHQWSRVGYKPGDTRVQLRGAINQKEPVNYDPLTKVLWLSPYVDSKEIAEFYLKRMGQFGVKFLHGYPGAIALFALMVKKHDLSIPFKLKAVLFASEVVYDWEREITQEAFGCRVFDFYGLAEHVIMAAECESSHYYHCAPQYGITEIDPKTHEIIGTGFLNYVNPFIRYRTTDVATTPVSLKCTKCGRNYFPVFERIEGRLEDFIVTPQGAFIAPAIITHPFKDLKTIKDTQIVQKSMDHIILRIIPWDKKGSMTYKAEVKQLSRNLQRILGADMQIKIEETEGIERTKSGKFKWIVSDVSKDMLEKGLVEVG